MILNEASVGQNKRTIVDNMLKLSMKHAEYRPPNGSLKTAKRRLGLIKISLEENDGLW